MATLLEQAINCDDGDRAMDVANYSILGVLIVVLVATVWIILSGRKV